MSFALPRFFLAIAAACLLAPGVLAAEDAKGFQTVGVQLYAPAEAMQERVPNVPEFADFIKAIQKVCTEHYAETVAAEDLAIVVAVKPRNRARFWFISARHTSEHDFDTLRGKLGLVPAPKVISGPVAFVLHASIAGGAPETPAKEPPIPKEWREAAEGAPTDPPLLVPDGYLALAWPD